MLEIIDAWTYSDLIRSMILRFKTPSTYPPRTSTAPHKINFKK